MEKKLYRSRTHRMLGGVCGGLAEYFNIDVTWIRLAWVIATLVYGSGLLIYFAAWLIIPENRSSGNDVNLQNQG